MSFDTKGYRRAARQAGIPTSLIEKTIADKTGLAGWLSNGKTGLGGVLSGVGNILNIPSYAVGGLLNRYQDVLGYNTAQGKQKGLGIIEGLKNKRAVMSELPETFGIDPRSKLGMGVGLAGELITPNIPVGKAMSSAWKGARGADRLADISKFGSKAFSKVSRVGDDAARVLLEKSYKLSASDINKIAKAIGVTDEAEKAIKVIDYLENLGLKGSTRGSLRTLNKITNSAQTKFNKLARTGGQISRTPYIENLLDEAIKAEGFDTPQARRLAKKMFDEAYLQSKKSGQVLTDTDLTNRISKLFNEATESSLSDPLSSNVSKRMAIAGQNAREVLRPGTTKMGRTLRGFRTAQEVLGKKANTGLGTQLMNAFKPGATGFGVGMGIGYSRGDNPLKSGLVGAGAVTLANNPLVMNTMGKLLRGAGNIKMPQLPKIPTAIGRLGQTGLRVSLQERNRQNQQLSSQQRLKDQSKRKQTGVLKKSYSNYKPAVKLSTVGEIKNPFKRVKKIKRGSFY